MGLAFLIKDADFSSANLGKVTLAEDIDVTSISISVVEKSLLHVQCAVSFYPTTTSQRDVIWSIVEGSSYATVDNNGKVTFKNITDNRTVTVKATSTSNRSISDTLEVSPISPVFSRVNKTFNGDSSNIEDTGFYPFVPQNDKWTLFIDDKNHTSGCSAGVFNKEANAAGFTIGRHLTTYTGKNSNPYEDFAPGKIALVRNGSSYKATYDGVNYVEVFSFANTTDANKNTIKFGAIHDYNGANTLPFVGTATMLIYNDVFEDISILFND